MRSSSCLSGNFGAIPDGSCTHRLAGLPVPFAPVHLLFINLLTDSLPAIALGLEPHNPEVMKEKPRAMGESILTKPFLTSIGVEGLCIGIMTMTAFMIGYRDGNAVLGKYDGIWNTLHVAVWFTDLTVKQTNRSFLRNDSGITFI